MQINNNSTSPNFGMALRIKPGAADALKKLPEETLQKLLKAGEELKDTKYCDLVVDDSGNFIVDAHSALKLEGIRGASPDTISPEYLNIEGTYVGTPSGSVQYGKPYKAFFGFPDKSVAFLHWKNISGANSSLDKAIETVKAIEASGAYKAAKAAEKAKQEAKINGMVNDLLSQFSEEA